MDIKQQVRSFITANFYVADPSALADDVSLLDHGIIDSTGVLEIILFLEETFGLTILDSEMVPENLDSIDNIGLFIARKLS